ncbi:MAG: hypothetical protein JXX14_04075, partial [Deltaproteobacteria bacterium]|nr:hypothetical protein [Deltaproteobacteria bacterium]
MISHKSISHSLSLSHDSLISGQSGTGWSRSQQRLTVGILVWIASAMVAGCSTSQPEPGHYLPDSNTSLDTVDSATATSAETDSDTEWDTTIDCSDIEPCAEHGRCVERKGSAACVCDDGWAGTTCDECAAGWHEVGDECRLDEQCLSTSCAFHEVKGGCDVEDGRVVCECKGNWDEDNHCATCLPGYHEEDDECVEDQYCVRGGPCENDGICSEQSGILVCDCTTAGDSRVDGEHWTGEYCEICPDGFHVVDENCIPNDECTKNACGDAGTCVVAESGTAICICDKGWNHEDTTTEFSPCTVCATGYHHPDGDKTECVEDDVCEPLSCGVGTCRENSSGGIDCECPDDTVLDPEFNCSQCLPEYHWVIGIGCVQNDADCDVSDPCGTHGTCMYADGVKSCDCDPMYTGTFCDRCIDGYQDRDDNGICAPDCATAEDNGLECGSHGDCTDASGVAICDCSGQWSGASCEVCPEGNHLVGGDCVINDTCEPDSCNGHGTCTVPADTGEVACDCDDGWMDDFYGSPCAVCASGYQNTYSADDCQPTCATAVAAGMDCGDNGACALNTLTGDPHCACDTGYAGEDCSLCDAGYHFEGLICIANDSSCDVSDPCGDHGTCVYSGGVKSCQCDTLYTGTACLDCVTGYQDANSDGECRPNCTTAAANGLDCGDNGHCVIDPAAGLAECECTGNFSGADCSACATGFHLVGGVCEPDEVCSSAVGPCVNGSCDVVAGLIQCTCDPGYVRDADGYCTQCASGYHPDGDACVIDEVCVEGVSCSGRGECDDNTGVIVCTSCTGGFTRASLCASCSGGMHESG